MVGGPFAAVCPLAFGQKKDAELANDMTKQAATSKLSFGGRFSSVRWR
jgi:hypothetical protein